MVILGSIVEASPDDRIVSIAPTAGLRSFEPDLKLQDELQLGARIGIGVARRMTIWTDFTYSNPLRKTTGKTTSVYGLHVAAQLDLTGGRVFPYLLAGAGGLLYSFGDQASNAAGTLVGGAGVGFRAGRRTALFMEGSGEAYRSRSVSFSYDGDPVFGRERTTNWNKSVLLGLAVGF